ncbi:hypothetical protein ACEPPU_24275 [Priestia aryabhattai]|uniref:hypothetical protein n=1 Tax=Priestia aryabhattai TaxID=412384 RepID=UPI0035AB7F3B
MSEYQHLINELARELPHREDLLNGVDRLIQKYEQGTQVVHIVQYTPNLDDLCQSHVKVSDYEKECLEEKLDTAKRLVKDIASLL